MKETVGKVAAELMQKVPDSRDPIELERELHAEYEKDFNTCLNRGIKDLDGDFYVIVITKKERLMANVLRHYFFYRISCPTPDYDQTVYRYKRASDEIEFVWVIPSRDTCFLMKGNTTHIVPEEYELLENVLKFADGTLYKLAKKLNGEADNSSALVI